MISNSKKFIFVHIPKTGGSSIEKDLISFFDENIKIVGSNSVVDKSLKNPIKNSYNSFKHATSLELIDEYGINTWNEFYKFSVVRKAQDRLISLYFWKEKNRRYNKDFFIKETIPHLEKTNPDNGKRSLWTINKYICDNENNLLVDQLIDYENFSLQYNNMLDEKLNIDVKSKNYINKSRKIGIDDYYNDTELIDIIKEVYKNENKFFNFNEAH
jgi:hypothetical protein